MSAPPRTDLEEPAGVGASRRAVWLFAPVAMVLFLAVRDRILPSGRAGSLTPPETPDSLGVLVPLNGVEGEMTRATDGARLLVRLEPLHPDPRRQAFDAEVLAERFGLEDSEPLGEAKAQPWRLTLVAEPGPPVAGTPQPGTVDPDSIEPLPLVASLSGVTVAGLQRLGAAPGSEGAGIQPLIALLGGTDAPLEVGERCDLVLWGPMPKSASIDVPGLGSLNLLPEVREARRRSEAVAWRDARAPEEPGEAR